MHKAAIVQSVIEIAGGVTRQRGSTNVRKVKLRVGEFRSMVGAAFLGMIPAGLKQAPAVVVTATALIGMALFFALEKFLQRLKFSDKDEVVSMRPFIVWRRTGLE
jgi:Zn finger protein HypA/HybF involved in hydrogenase expression